MQVLWLRYLTEINSRTRTVPEEFTSNPVINKAVVQLEVSAFSDAQLLGYDRFWDMVSTAKMQISSSRKEGFRRGHKEGLEEGRKEGMKEERIKNARGMKAEGIADVIIARITGLAPEEIAALK